MGWDEMERTRGWRFPNWEMVDENDVGIEWVEIWVRKNGRKDLLKQ